jgi:hypothetical protein
MKRLILAATLLFCVLSSTRAGEIDGTGKTPPPPPPPCTENCTQATTAEEPSPDVVTLEFIELMIGLLVAR